MRSRPWTVKGESLRKLLSVPFVADYVFLSVENGGYLRSEGDI